MKVSQWLITHHEHARRREVFLSGYTKWEQRMIKRFEYDNKEIFVSKGHRISLSELL